MFFRAFCSPRCMGMHIFTATKVWLFLSKFAFHLHMQLFSDIIKLYENAKRGETMKQNIKPWITIQVMHSPEQADAAREILESEGFLVNVHALAHSVSQAENCFEIMVLKSEASEARELLMERGY